MYSGPKCQMYVYLTAQGLFEPCTQEFVLVRHQHDRAPFRLWRLVVGIRGSISVTDLDEIDSARARCGFLCPNDFSVEALSSALTRGLVGNKANLTRRNSWNLE